MRLVSAHCIAICLVLVGTAAEAAVISDVLESGDDLTADGTFTNPNSSTLNVFLLTEQTDFEVPTGGMPIDIDFSGGSNRNTTLAQSDAVPGTGGYPLGGTIAAGTKVQTFIFHVDVDGTISGNFDTSHVLNFENEIVGVQWWDSSDADDNPENLDQGDGVFAVAGVTYSTDPIRRGSGATDTVNVALDGLSMTVASRIASDGYDTLRIITAVPEPSTLVIAGFALAALGLLVRRK